MRFIDLFAGLGGFHVAMSALPMDSTCVFASELCPDLRELYHQNFGIRPHGDIRTIPMDSIPEHDILFGGWPCQPFSTVGKKKGFNDDSKGDLFYYIERILEARRPPKFLLENVPALLGKKFAAEATYILNAFQRLGYHVQVYVMSPTQFGVPQHRIRVFLYGSQERIRGHLKPHHDVRSRFLPHFGTSLRDIMIPREHVEHIPIHTRIFLTSMRRHRIQHQLEQASDFCYHVTHMLKPIPNPISLDKGTGYRDTAKTLLTVYWSWPIHLQKPYRVFSPREGARLQSFPDTHQLPDKRIKAQHAIGNAINTTVAQRILEYHCCEILNSSETTLIRH